MERKQLCFNTVNTIISFSIGVILILVISTLPGFSQAKFIKYGRITYERSQNQYQLVGEEKINSSIIMQEVAKGLPKFLKDEYVLDFDLQRSAYKWSKESQENKTFWQISKPSKEDKVVMNFNEQSVLALKEGLGEQYHIEDSLRRYRWKISDEVRTIAGFDCRKAITTICDSVVVVAFYTDEIPVPAGPENFNGLPGMILGLAIPRLYTTWFATKLELIPPSNELFDIKRKKKRYSYEEFTVSAKKLVSKLEEDADRRYWEMVL